MFLKRKRDNNRMMKIYGHEKTRTFRVLWLLEELNLKYEHISLDFANKGHESTEFLALNPSGKVPVLVDNQNIIHESSTILFYLADVYGKNTSFDLTKVNRHKIFQWLIFGSSELEQGLWTAARHTFVLPKDQRIEVLLGGDTKEFYRALTYTSEMLDNREYLVDNTFSIADILTAPDPALGLTTAKLDLKYENIKKYLKRCISRPSFEYLVRKYKK